MSGDFNQKWDDELERREERRFLRELINDDPDFWRGSIGLKLQGPHERLSGLRTTAGPLSTEADQSDHSGARDARQGETSEASHDRI